MPSRRSRCLPVRPDPRIKGSSEQADGFVCHLLSTMKCIFKTPCRLSGSGLPGLVACETLPGFARPLARVPAEVQNETARSASLFSALPSSRLAGLSVEAITSLQTPGN